MPLTQPPRNAAGEVTPHDHDGIVADDVIVRRVSEYQLATDKDGKRRISSVLYKASTGTTGMSINIEKLIVEAGLDPKQYVSSPKWTGSVWFTAGALRGFGLMVGYDPVEDPKQPDPHHGEAWGVFNKGQVNSLKKAAQWYVEIADVSLT